MRNSLNLNNGRISWILALGVLLVLSQPFFPACADDGAIRFTVKEFIIDGQSPIAAGKVEKALKPYTARPLVFADLEAAAGALQSAFLDAGYPFHKVLLPPQRIVDGRVQLRVVGYPLKEIRIEENQHFDEPNILRSLPPLQPGRSPSTLDVARALQFANQHPARRVAVFVKQAAKSEGIDARVVVRDARPYTMFGSLNNTGTRDPARTRAALGVQYSNLFNRDHILTATYTTSPESVHDVNQYGVDYRLPLYAIATELEAFYSYSEVDQGRIGSFFDVSGRGQFYGLTATHTLTPIGVFNHKLAVGYQDRFFDNETKFVGTLLLPDVRSTPVSFRYSFLYEPKNLSLGGYAAWGFNTGFGSRNDSANYLANREGADANWNKFNGGGDLRWTLPGDYQVRAHIDGQYSDEPLIPGEQFGIGGSASVRGYEEREVTGDCGVQASLEAWSPPLVFDSRLVLFADAGQVYRRRPHTGVDGRQEAYGVGIGLRWNWKGYLDMSVDVAQPLEDGVSTEAGETRILYRVFLRY